MSALLIAAALSTVVAGAFVQRLSGMGFSLLTGPLLVLLDGPRNGVALTNLLSIVVALTIVGTSVRYVDRAKLAVLVPAGLVGVLPGALAARLLPAGPLQVCVGAITILGLAAVTLPRLRVEPGPAVTLSAGLTSGFTSAVAGAGGPALALYSVATRWPQQEFAATCQICFATQAIAALAIKGLPGLPVTWIGGTVAAALLGLVVGTLLAGRVSSSRTRQAAMILAALASVATIVGGLLH